MKIFPIYYCPPISWFAAAAQEQKIILEQHQHYRKQNYFNRMQIKSPNKVLNLSIPIQKNSENSPLNIRKIFPGRKWRKDHWRSLEAAYRSSPYFEFYEDRIRPFFEGEEESLLEFNLGLLDTLRKAILPDLEWELTDSFKATENYEADFRPAFDPRSEKSPDWFVPEPYTQVFDGFDPDLSILDLLFNKGPEARGYLKRTFV